ncbi:caspase domain-containing protein [Streptomyces sp. NPDC056796]|uniref:caspase family protein n=1 Tax=Streptomyces sp. NPDC056796 TaxID=3345947 RepID=UPI0036A2A359
MATLYALFVGIDDYPERPLEGCVNDVQAARSWLERRSGLTNAFRTLHNAQATHAAVRAGIGDHLGRGGPGDTALLWFSGHGSSQETDDPREATGRSQALVCHDSLDRGGQALLQDSELGALLDAVAARGTHVVAVLDCCHSGGATRDGASGTTARGVPWRPWWPTDRPGGVRDGGGEGPEPLRHVLLAACRPQELAYERVIDGKVRGQFSHAMLDVLGRQGPATTYGALHALVEERVHGLNDRQHPQLRGPEDARFLYGNSVRTSPHLLRHTVSGWEVDCGHAHGLRSPGTEFTLLDDGEVPRVVVVRDVRPESSSVEPVGWRPVPGDRDRVHAVTPSALAFPPPAITVSGDPATTALVPRPPGSEPASPSDTGRLRLHVTAADGWARISGGGGHPVPDLPLRTPADAERVADCLAHIARWHHIRDLANPDPWLSSLVRVTVEETPVGTLTHTADGEVVCAYTPDGRQPQVRVRIHNGSGRDLWCVLLDLTDSYAVSPHLYEGEFIADGRAGAARRGEPVWLSLPAGRAVTRGAYTRDWLKVIATENELNLAPFRLGAWSPETAPSARGGGDAERGGVLRLTGAGGGRDAGGPAQGSRPGRWGTAHVVVRTQVP